MTVGYGIVLCRSLKVGFGRYFSQNSLFTLFCFSFGLGARTIVPVRHHNFDALCSGEGLVKYKYHKSTAGRRRLCYIYRTGIGLMIDL